MVTLAGQATLSAVLLIFAYLSWRILRRLQGDASAFRFGWALTASIFTMRGVNSAFHDVFSIAAYLSGPESRLWSAVIFWHPILNHSRTFLMTAFCVVLGATLVRIDRGRAIPPVRGPNAVIVGGMLLGAAVGWREPAFSGLTHYSAVALWDIMELLALLGLLMIGMVTGRMDRSLWFCLAVNGFVLALSVLWFAALSRIDFGGQWVPRRSHIHFTKAALYLVMVAIAYRQIRQLQRGKALQGFFDPNPGSMVPSLHG